MAILKRWLDAVKASGQAVNQVSARSVPSFSRAENAANPRWLWVCDGNLGTRSDSLVGRQNIVLCRGADENRGSKQSFRDYIYSPISSRIMKVRINAPARRRHTEESFNIARDSVKNEVRTAPQLKGGTYEGSNTASLTTIPSMFRYPLDQIYFQEYSLLADLVRR